jgi:His/Glu/Gln/Arg/opine family amino acid ABC transporter permease subunit
MYILSDEFAGYVNQLAIGARITIELFLCGFTLALLLGMLIGIATQSRHWLVQGLWRVYASIMTGVPSLLVIFLLYYGGSAIITALFGKTRFEVTAFGAGLAALTIVYAAYVAELIHGAVRNLPRGQFEAARALGIKRAVMWIHVIMPQVLRLAFPGLVNIWIVVLKDTPLVSLAGLNDLVANSKIAAGATKEPFVFFIVAALFFIAFSGLTLRLANRLEVRLSRGLVKVKE